MGSHNPEYIFTFLGRIRTCTQASPLWREGRQDWNFIWAPEPHFILEHGSFSRELSVHLFGTWKVIPPLLFWMGKHWRRIKKGIVSDYPFWKSYQRSSWDFFYWNSPAAGTASKIHLPILTILLMKQLQYEIRLPKSYSHQQNYVIIALNFPMTTCLTLLIRMKAPSSNVLAIILSPETSKK